ncbi:MAG: 4Fe-4S ferredoxin, partial [Bacillota bacterium]|nr:4Fe-4S ferredoxin [Bacillota bacterium]
NFLLTFKIEDEIKNKNPKEIEERLRQIGADIRARKNHLTRKGIPSDVISKYGRRLADRLSYNFAYKRFQVNDKCNGCKICAKVCPVNNIYVNEKPEFSHQCEVCFACIHHCPQNAIHLKSERSQARFINQNVKLKEIIDANHQGM